MMNKSLSSSMRLVASVAIAVGVLFSSAAAWAKVSSTTLVELIASSDLVVLGQVVEVEKVDSEPVATMQVTEVWKGRSEPRIRYDVRRAWACDVSDAQVGETAVIFLIGGAPTGAMVLAHSGRGRFPIVVISGVQYVRARTEGLVLPVDLPVEWLARADGTFDSWVKLSDLRDYVKAKAQPHDKSDAPPNNRLKLPARGRPVADARLRTRAAA
jgi:hypothetical protein